MTGVAARGLLQRSKISFERQFRPGYGSIVRWKLQFAGLDTVAQPAQKLFLGPSDEGGITANPDKGYDRPLASELEMKPLSPLS